MDVNPDLHGAQFGVLATCKFPIEQYAVFWIIYEFFVAHSSHSGQVNFFPFMLGEKFRISDIS
jgi:hypothetical protein